MDPLASRLSPPIASTPEKPVHCVVWAKELYKLLFADPKTSMMFEENPEESVYMHGVSGVRS